MAKFSEGQLIAIAWVPRCTSLLSVLGSSAIIYVIVSGGKQKLSKTYHRILLCMSLMDWLQSAAHSFSTAAIPAGTEEVYGAIGNVHTCTAQGFFLAAGYAVPMYNVALSFYYVMATLDKRAPRKLEPYFHLIALGFPLVMAVAGVIGEDFNNLGTICFYNEYPLKCSKRDVECTRGLHAQIYIKTLGLFLFLAFIIIPTNMLILYIIVYRQQSIMRNKYFNKKSNTLHSSVRHSKKKHRKQHNAPNFSSVYNNHKTHSKKTNKERSLLKLFNIEKTRDRQVAFQALCYVMTFMLTFASTVIDGIIWIYKPGHRSYFLIIFSKIFYPMQGFFNFLIFIRPRTIRIARQNPNDWYPCILIKAVFNKGSHKQYKHPQRKNCNYPKTLDPHHSPFQNTNKAHDHNNQTTDSSEDATRRDSLNILNHIDPENILEYNHKKNNYRDSLNIIDCSEALQKELMQLCISDSDEDDDITSQTNLEKGEVN